MEKLNRPLLIFVFSVLSWGTAVSGQRDGQSPPEPPIDGFNLPGTVQDASAVSLGIPGLLVKNDFNIFANPSLILQYGTAYGEIWNSASWGGATFRIRGLKFGLFLARPYTGHTADFTAIPDNVNTFLPNQTQTNLSYYGFIPFGGLLGLTGAPVSGDIYSFGTVLVPVNHLDLLTGLKLGNLAVGLKLTYADNSEARRYSPTAAAGVDGSIERRSYTGDHHATLGTLIPGGGSLQGVDISVDLGLLFFHNIYREDRTSDGAWIEQGLRSKGAYSVSLLVRPIFSLGKARLILPVTFGYVNEPTRMYSKQDSVAGGPLEVDRSFSIDHSALSGGLLAALHTEPVAKLTVIYSIAGLANYKKVQAGVWGNYNDTSSTFEFRVPAAVSAEYGLTEWFMMRFGVAKSLYYRNNSSAVDRLYSGATLTQTQEFDSAVSRSLVSNNELAVSCGVGFKIRKKMDIDLVVRSFQSTAWSLDSLVAGASLKFHY